MFIFEEPVESICTMGPPHVLKVEQRVENPGTERQRSYGVVIYRCKQKATPVLRGDQWVMPAEAFETNFVRVRANSDGGCEEPPNAGKLLGHYREDGSKWWVFQELLAPSASDETPGAAAPRKAAGESRPAAKASAASAGSPGKPAGSPASPPAGSPGSTSARRSP